jgi:hypothetical protein
MPNSFWLSDAFWGPVVCLLVAFTAGLDLGIRFQRRRALKVNGEG